MSFTRSSLMGAIAAAAFAVLSPAQATTVNSNFNVNITIGAKCIFTASSINDINYGTHFTTATTPSEVNLGGQTAFSVLCTKNTGYTVTMSPTGSTGNGAGTLKGSTGNADTIAYTLYKENGHTNPWGTGNNATAGTGTGIAFPYTVFSLIPTIGNVLPDTYTDQVTVSVIY